jgi:predicted DNA-binding transcriptional regulator YafY
LNLLRQSGIPVEFDQTYRLAADKTFIPLEFSLKEFLTLQLMLDSSIMKSNRFLRETAQQLLSKIQSRTDQMSDISGRSVKERLKIDVKQTGQPLSEAIVFPAIERAISSQTAIRLSYESLKSGIADRMVDPYALVFKRHAWYLVGFDHKTCEYRVFRLSRIKKFTLLRERFERDSDFSLSELFKNSWELFVGELNIVKIKFTGKAAKIVSSGCHHPSEQLSPQKDGSLVYTATVGGLEEISHWVLSFGPLAEVLEPAELRESISAKTDELSLVYKAKDYNRVADRRPKYTTKSESNRRRTPL